MATKENKQKPAYSLWSNAVYLYGIQWKYSKLSFIFVFGMIPINIVLSYCGILLPRAAVNAVIENAVFSQMLVSIGSIALVITALNCAARVISTYNSALMSRFRNSLIYLKTKKHLYTDYQNLESPACLNLIQRADESLWGSGDGSAMERMVKGSAGLINNILGYILFGTVLSFASPWIVLILTVLPLGNYLLLKAIQKYQYINKDATVKLDRKLSYIVRKTGDFKSAKDIRIYGMSQWLMGMYEKIAKERLRWDKKFAVKYFASDILNGLMVLLRDGAAYIILISLAVNGKISIGDFVMYFAAVSSFAGWIGGIIGEFSAINGVSLSACDLRTYLSYPEKSNRNKGRSAPEDISAYSIELKNVCFRYEGAEKDTISGINLCIKGGEKVAIVGLNGAGKTTLIKLICGLYAPTTGEITVAGNKKDDYNIFDYYSLFSVVFQDRHFLPMPLKSVVSCSVDGEEDIERVSRCIDAAGLTSKIDSLERGLDTPLNKQLNNGAVELSGGEEQKLLLARALYKGSPVLILDEPTAALDPIAESNLYLRYKDMSAGRTAIFISHRLASTSFCDRVLYMENGSIAESGSHKELLELGGKYAELFKTQSQYYQE